jgi:excisionase family DNA binding protein
MIILSSSELARRWRVSERVIRSLVSDGELSALRNRGRLGFPAADIAEFEGGPGQPLCAGPLLTPEEVAALSSYATSTIKTYARLGLIPSCRVGGQRRFRRADVDAWIARAFRSASENTATAAEEAE